MKTIMFVNGGGGRKRGETFAAVGIAIAAFGAAAFFGKALAAGPRIYLSGPEKVAVNQTFSVKLLIDSERPVNAYAIGLSYSTDKLEIAGFDNSRSIIDVSPGQPTVSEKSGIVLRGGSLAPFRGEGGEILTINFRTKAAGEARVGFLSPKIYLADGLGTKVVPLAQNLTLDIVSSSVPTAPPEESAAKNGNGAPPTVKYLSLVRDPFNSNQKLLGFSVSGGSSGIKEISARYRSYFWWSDRIPAQNPTAVPDSAWTVDLKITDNAGNVAEKIIYDWRAGLPFFISVAAAAAAVAVFLIYRKRRRSRF